MKKIFTLMAAAAMVVSVSAQVQVLPELNLGTNDEGNPITKGTLAAGTVLVDNDAIKATTVWDANCGINEVPFSKFDASIGDLSSWIEMRVKDNPSAENPYGTQNGAQTPIVFSTKADMSLSVYVRTGNNKVLIMTNTADFAAVEPEKDNIEDENSNDLFLWTYELKANNEYVLTEKGGTGRFYGFQYTVAEGGDVEEPGDEALMHWDFTNWSAETAANLKAGANWTDDEKGDGVTVDNNCFWQISATEGLSADKYVMANDVVIAELEGLIYTNVKDRSLAIAVNYPSTSLGTYHGAEYLWFGGKNLNYFVIPGVPAGATIKMGVESHKNSEARGVKLLIGDTELTAPNGDPVAYPTTYEEQEWLVPAEGAELNDVQITNNNGCHIYFITVTEGEAGGTTGVAAVEAEGAVEYYNLQGVRVANPENGLYIKRQGNKAVKVLVK